MHHVSKRSAAGDGTVGCARSKQMRWGRCEAHRRRARLQRCQCTGNESAPQERAVRRVMLTTGREARLQVREGEPAMLRRWAESRPTDVDPRPVRVRPVPCPSRSKRPALQFALSRTTRSRRPTVDRDTDAGQQRPQRDRRRPRHLGLLRSSSSSVVVRHLGRPLPRHHPPKPVRHALRPARARNVPPRRAGRHGWPRRGGGPARLARGLPACPARVQLGPPRLRRHAVQVAPRW